MLVRAKNNLGPDSGGFAHDLEPLELPEHHGVPTTRICGGGETLEDSARSLLSQSDPPDDPGGAVGPR